MQRSGKPAVPPGRGAGSRMEVKAGILREPTFPLCGCRYTPSPCPPREGGGSLIGLTAGWVRQDEESRTQNLGQRKRQCRLHVTPGTREPCFPAHRHPSQGLVIPVKASEEHGPYTEERDILQGWGRRGDGCGRPEGQGGQWSEEWGQSGDRGGQVFGPCSSCCLAQQGSAWGGREITASLSFLLGH